MTRHERLYAQARAARLRAREARIMGRLAAARMVTLREQSHQQIRRIHDREADREALGVPAANQATDHISGRGAD